jgi:hypothetical protein
MQGGANAKKIEDELKNLINKQWDWQVKQVGGLEYIAVFSDKGTLETFSKISKILLSLHGIKVKFLKFDWDPEAIEILQPTCMKIYGLPTIACKEEVVLKVASLAGEQLVVNELSMIKTGPVRVKINCRVPFKLKGFVRIVFNLTGYEIRFLSEKYKEKAQPLPHHTITPRMIIIIWRRTRGKILMKRMT